MATFVIKLISKFTLSPGITISTPCGQLHRPRHIRRLKNKTEAGTP